MRVNHGNSYLSFAAEPGEHRIRVDWQSSLRGRQQLSAAADLTVEAGKSYFYHVRVIAYAWEGHKEDVQLKEVDAAEGPLLISKSALSS